MRWSRWSRRNELRANENHVRVTLVRLVDVTDLRLDAIFRKEWELA